MLRNLPFSQQYCWGCADVSKDFGASVFRVWGCKRLGCLKARGCHFSYRRCAVICRRYSRLAVASFCYLLDRVFLDGDAVTCWDHYTAAVVCTWRRLLRIGGMIAQVLGEKPVPVPTRTPQIPYRLAWDWFRALVVSGRRPTAWAMGRSILCGRLKFENWGAWCSGGWT
jgi:hypothetical protein